MTGTKLEVAKAAPNDAGRRVARLAADILIDLGVGPGDVVAIEGSELTAAKLQRADRSDRDSDTVQIDSFTRQNAGASIGERVTIRPADPEPAAQLVLAPTEDAGGRIGGDAASMVKRHLLKDPLVEDDLVPVTASPDSRFRRSSAQAIPLVAVDTAPGGILTVTEDTDIQLRTTPVNGVSQTSDAITYEDIGGLDKEVQRIREMIELPLKYPQLFETLGIDPPKGVLLHGPPGTGKTLLAKAVANETDASFSLINGPEIISKYYGESEQRLRETFEDAEQEAPAIIFIDELDSIAPERDRVTGEVERRVVAQLLSLMDGLDDRGDVIVIAATNRVDDVDPALRRPGRLDRELELDVPNETGRHEILQIHTRGMPLAEDIDLDALAADTHGFVGADIESLTTEAAMHALRRYLPEIDLDEETIPPSLIDRMLVNHEDIQGALAEIEPSALREVLVELPEVTWDDVGGAAEAKRDLKESVEWPLTAPERFDRLGIEPPTGVLLYGPPGTGKTLMAKAVANETDANFISVRGPELLSKWVGESEEAIRDTFKKAQEASPCVVFFDELDSLAGGRNGGTGHNVSERVVNQLLSELDGLQTLEDVMVIGATNRPDMLDPALVRSGRFDRLLHVGEPDSDGREQILEIHTREMPLGPDVSLREFAERTEGYVGSDLESIAREAAIRAIREDPNGEPVETRHFNDAIEDVRPTLTDDLREYYEQVEEEFRGETEPLGRRGSRLGFQ